MSGVPQELYSLLIPLESERLLVPRMCVAEVISFAEPELPAGRELPHWFLGHVDWNGRQLPVISFERTGAGTPEALPKKRGRTRIVVLHAITPALRSGYYGILTQGFPQLVRVNRDVLGVESEWDWPDSQPALCRVRMIHEYPLIPDVERIEQMLAELAATAA